MSQKGNKMTTMTLDQMRVTDVAISELYVARNRQIARKEMLKRTPVPTWKLEDWKARLASTNLEISVIDERIAELNKAYTGWSRFFHVKHLHASPSCSSFRWNTRIVFVPEISGLTEIEAVEEFGKDLCTICFKSAPTK